MARPGRLLAAAGYAYPVLMTVAFLAFPAPPGGDVSPAADPTWLAGHVDSVVAQCLVRALGAVGFLLLGVAATGWMPRLPGRAAVAAATACATLLLLAQGFTFAAALAARAQSDPAVVATGAALNAAALDLSSLPAVVLFAAAAHTFLTQPHAPRWLGVVSLVGVPLGLIDAMSYDGGPFAMFGVVGLAYFLLWSLLTTTFLVRRPEADAVRPTVSSGPMAGVPVH